MNDENLVEIQTRPDHKELAAKGGRNRKGVPNIKTTLKRLLAAKDSKSDWTSPIAEQLIKKAFLNGDMKALIEIIDRLEGKIAGTPVIDQSNHIHYEISWKSADEKVQVLR